jgi:hypothetical protein
VHGVLLSELRELEHQLRFEVPQRHRAEDGRRNRPVPLARLLNSQTPLYNLNAGLKFEQSFVISFPLQ